MVLSHRRTWGYVGWEYILSFAVAFLFFFFLFFVNQILIMAEQIFSRKVPAIEIARLLLYSIPIVIAFSFPFGSLLGALMAVGRLSSDNELLAFGSLGIRRGQILAPLLLLGLAFSSVSFVMNDYFMPLGNLRLAETYRRIISANPALELDPYSVKRYEGVTIITGPVDGSVIKDILIFDKTQDGVWRVIQASSARLEQTTQQDVVSLKLDHVFTQVPYPKEGDRYDYTASDTLVYTLKLDQSSGTFVGGRSPSTMSSRDVWKEILSRSGTQEATARQSGARAASLAFGLSAGLRAAERAAAASPDAVGAQRQTVAALWRDWATEAGRNTSDQTLQAYRVEFHRRFSMPAACLVFALFAFPVGSRARRSGRTVGFGIGLFVAIVYWGLLIAGQTFGVRMSLSPGFSMWLPDATVLTAAAVLLMLGRRR
jgi:lipopolysaccharide export system permease protein